MESMKSTLKNEIHKNIESKQKEKIKLLCMLLCSNLFVFVATYTLMSSPTEDKIESVKTFTAKKEHSLIIAPLKLMADYEDQELIVSLLGENNQILVAKAYVVEKVRTEGELSFFKIEISNSDLLKIRTKLSLEMVAIPYVEETTKKLTLGGGNNYEVDF